MLKLPARVRLQELPDVWRELEAALRAEQAQVRQAAGNSVRLNLAALHDFDSAALTLLLSAMRLLKQQGLSLELSAAPNKLRELARVYGVASLLWADEPPAAA
ncbi:STAS domain-containing protein [Paucibacter soli]|uniref:STAS domain-containing protein n=1 Tax=Paucibacter soli TaxID=3133433 RepID=UPI0030984BD0